jgi:hypothetical protein
MQADESLQRAISGDRSHHGEPSGGRVAAESGPDNQVVGYTLSYILTVKPAGIISTRKTWHPRLVSPTGLVPFTWRFRGRLAA